MFCCGFFKVGGVVIVGVVVGGVGGVVIGVFVVGGSGWNGFVDDLDFFVVFMLWSELGFDYFVVVMGENCFFDNFFGYLYLLQNLLDGEKFEGLNFGFYSNIVFDGMVVDVYVYIGDIDWIMSFFDLDFGEEYLYVNMQIFGMVDFKFNVDLFVDQMSVFFNVLMYGEKVVMFGFFQDYIINFWCFCQGKELSIDEVRYIMGLFLFEMFLVLLMFVVEFVVFDYWYVGVLLQIFCNWFFFYVLILYGFVMNQVGGGYCKWIEVFVVLMVFNCFEDEKFSWKVYIDKFQFVFFMGMFYVVVLEKYWCMEYFGMMEDFYVDVKNGIFFVYVFIELCMVYDYNDFYLLFGKLCESEVDGEFVFDSVIFDVCVGDWFIYDIYEVVCMSVLLKGLNVVNILLLIMFDEYGGCYDYVLLFVVIKFIFDMGVGEMGFIFDWFGCCVLVIVVLVYMKCGMIIYDEMYYGLVIVMFFCFYGFKLFNDCDQFVNILLNVVNFDKF